MKMERLILAWCVGFVLLTPMIAFAYEDPQMIEYKHEHPELYKDEPAVKAVPVTVRVTKANFNDQSYAVTCNDMQIASGQTMTTALNIAAFATINGCNSIYVSSSDTITGAPVPMTGSAGSALSTTTNTTIVSSANTNSNINTNRNTNTNTNINRNGKHKK